MDATAIGQAKQTQSDEKNKKREREMEIPHFSHEHPLNLQRVDDSGETCNACSRPIFDQGYACSSCGFFLHEKCAQLPHQLLGYHLHPQHPLSLVFDPPKDSEILRCTLCGKTHPGFMYRCNKCKYNIDVNCCSKNQVHFPVVAVGETTRKLQHFSHEHALKLSYFSTQSASKCKACDLLVSGPAYRCTTCGNFTLHQSCAQLPQRMEHPCHPSHSLSLLTQSPYPSKSSSCNACLKPIVGFEFHCSLCKADFDLTCLSISPSLKHKNHSHPLYFFEDINLDVPCASCAKKSRDSLYRCLPCSYNVHSTCLPFQKIVKHEHHEHTLLLKDSVVKEDSALFFCESCKKRITRKQRIYYCTECKYGVHLECVNMEDLPSPGKLLEEIAKSQEEAETTATNLKRDINSLSQQLQALVGKHSGISNLQSKLKDRLKADD